MIVIIYLLAIFGLSFFIKESDGPFEISLRLRNLLMTNKYVGVFFYKLLSCYFCVGCHAGWIIYLLQMSNFSFSSMILWSLAGGTFSLFADKILSKLMS